MNRETRTFHQPEASRPPLDIVFAGICGATAAASVGAMTWLQFDRASLALAPVALAGVVGTGYFAWRRLRPQEATPYRTGSLGEALRAGTVPAPNLDDALQGFEETTLAQHPQRIAAALELATRGVNAQSETMREQLQTAADTTTTQFAVQTKLIADRLGAEQGRLTEALEIYGETIVSRLNTASVSLAREFRDSGEALNKRVETAGAAAVAGIARQAETSGAALARAVADAETRLGEAARRIVAQIEGVGSESGKKVVSVSEEVTNRLSRSVADLTEIVERTSREQVEATEARRRALSETLDADGRALSERGKNAGEFVESQLGAAGVAIERLVASAIERVEATLGTRAESLAARLGELDQELERRWTSRSRGLVAELTSAASQAEAAAAAAAAEVGRVAGAAADAARVSFIETAQDCARRWTASADAAARDIQTAAERSTRALSANGEALNARFAAFETSIADSGNSIAERLDGQTQALRAALDDARATVETGGGGLVTAIAQASGGLDGALAEHRAALSQTFDSHRETLASRADEDAATLRELAQSHTAALADVMAQHRASLTDGIADTLAQARKLAEAGEQDAVRGLTTVANGMVEGLIGEMRTLSETLGARGTALRDQILARQGEMIDVIEGGVARTERRFAESLRAAAEAVDGCGRTVQQILAQATQALKGALTENAREAAGLIDETGRVLEQTVHRAAHDGAGALTASVETQRRALEARIAEAVAQVETARLKLAETVGTAAQDADERMLQRGAETADALRASFEAATQALDAGRESFVAAAKDADRSLAARGADTVDALRASIDAAARTLDQGRESFVDSVAEAAQGVQAAFAARGQDSQRALADETNRALERLDAGRAAMAGAANEALARFEADFTRRLSELRASLEGVGERLSRDVGTPLRDDIARIEAEGQELSSATRALAETIVSTTTTHRERLHKAFADETDAMSKILDANAATFKREMENVVAGADDVFLSRGFDVARTIAARVTDLRALLDGDALTVLKGLESSSETVAKQIDAVSQRSLADFERKATSLINLLTRRGDDLLSSMSAAASESTRKVADLTGEIDAHTDRAGAALRDIERKVGAMLAAADRRNAEPAREAPKSPYLLGESGGAKFGSA